MLKRWIGRAASVGLIALTPLATIESASASDLMRVLAEGAAAAGSTPRVQAPISGSPTTISYYTEVPCAPAVGAPAAVHHVRRRVHHRHRARPAAPRAAPVVVPKPKPAAPPAVHHPHHLRRHRPRPHPAAVAAVAPTRCLSLHSSQLIRPSSVLDQDLLSNITEPVVDSHPYTAPPLLIDTPPRISAPLPWINPWGPPLPPGYPGPGLGVKGAPEPASWILLITGVAAIGAALRRRRRDRFV